MIKNNPLPDAVNHESRVRRYVSGKPVCTYAITEPDDFSAFPDMEISRGKDGKYSFSVGLENDTAVYGLGQNMGGINKRGRLYTSYCKDDPVHTEDKASLYAAHNFVMFCGRENKAYFIDFPGQVDFDLGFTDTETAEIIIHGKDFIIYEITGSTPEKTVLKFRKISGMSYIPPKWAFGYFQSRWGYSNEKDIREVADSFESNDIPLEGIFIDIDYMERFKDFTVDNGRFPDFAKLVSNLKNRNLRFIPIIDAGVKIEKGYSIYEEGLEGNHFVKDSSGGPYTAAVWPGHVHFPDFFRRETTEWWSEKMKILTDMGIEGVWNDMNEPAIFYDMEYLDRAVKKALENADHNLDIYSYFELRQEFTDLGNRREYYRKMIHNYGGRTLTNDELHNMYGYFMTAASAEGFKKHLRGMRYFLISRSSYTGMHRCAGIWTGDNSSWWSHLELNIKMMPSLSMSGFLFSGADTGGFGGNAGAGLLSRWLQFSIFTPLLRNHSCLNTRSQEPYAFGERYTAVNRSLIRIRYRLLPFIYSSFMKAALGSTMLFRPLSFLYSGGRIREIEDQIIFGENIMLAPVYRENTSGRTAFLPEDMLHLRISESGFELSEAGNGDYHFSYPENEAHIFLRPDSAVPLINYCSNTSSADMSMLTVVAYIENTVNFSLYDDDGISSTISDKNDMSLEIRFTLERDRIKSEILKNNSGIKTLKCAFRIKKGKTSEFSLEI